MPRSDASHPGSSGFRKGNLFHDLPETGEGEVFEELLRVDGFRLERIVSSDRPDPAPYDQGWDEWVRLLTGEAELEVEGETIVLQPGDHLHLPAHAVHRVIRTSREPRCIWLAVHLPERGRDDGRVEPEGG